jgi:hypothetical protein
MAAFTTIFERVVTLVLADAAVVAGAIYNLRRERRGAGPGATS